MGDKDKIYKKYNNLSSKLNLCYNTSINQIEDNNDPTIKLISNYDEIKNILKINEPNILKFLYINRNNNHQILYNCEKIIYLKILGNDLKSSIYLYFYLSLSIKEYSVVDYIYSIEFIRNLNEEQIREKHKIKKKIIMAKIIIDLIDNYESKDTDMEDDEDVNEDMENEDDKDKDINEIENDLKLIKNNNLEIIHNNIKDFEEFNLTEKDILSKNIDDIYITIIKYLIIKQKLEESEYNTNLMEEIGLKSINLTKKMFDEISLILDKEKSYLKDYIISKYEEIFNEEIITFYYVLLKYIIKSNYYIYQIPFLLKTRYNINKLIKSNLNLCDDIKEKKEIKDKILYVLKAFISYKWYKKMVYKKQLLQIKINNNSIINPNSIISLKSNYEDVSNNSYNSSNIFHHPSVLEAKKNDGKSFGNENPFTPVNQVNKDMCSRIMDSSTFTLNVYKEKDQTIIKIEQITINDIIEKIDIDKVNNLESTNEIVNNNYKIFLSVLNEIQKRIKNEYTKNYSFEVTLNFEKKYQDLINVMKCLYKLKLQGRNKLSFKDENILNCQIYNGLSYLISEINSN